MVLHVAKPQLGIGSTARRTMKAEVARNTGSPSTSSAIALRFSAMKRASTARSSPETQRASTKADHRRSQPVLCREPGLQHIELKGADDTHEWRRAVSRAKQLNDALPSELRARPAQLLCLHRIVKPHTSENLRREMRHADEAELLALGQRIAYTQCAVVGNPDDIAGESLVGDLPLAGNVDRDPTRLVSGHTVIIGDRRRSNTTR